MLREESLLAEPAGTPPSGGGGPPLSGGGAEPGVFSETEAPLTMAPHLAVSSTLPGVQRGSLVTTHA